MDKLLSRCNDTGYLPCLFQNEGEFVDVSDYMASGFLLERFSSGEENCDAQIDTEDWPSDEPKMDNTNKHICLQRDTLSNLLMFLGDWSKSDSITHSALNHLFKGSSSQI